MNIVITSLAIALATLATQAQAFPTRSNSQDWVDMMLQDSQQHPASYMHHICVYDSLLAGSYPIRVVMQGMCEYSIKFNVVTGMWRRN